MPGLYILEVIVGLPLADGEVGILGEETEIRDRINLAPLVPSGMEYSLRNM